MNALELLIYLTEKQIDRVFETARKLPPDKLDWKPAPGARSALNQLQEIATSLPEFWPAFTERKMEWDQEKMANWVTEREKITSLDELEAITREHTRRLIDLIKTLDEKDLTTAVQMPFPGPYNMADILSYHYWNAAYHEGQIVYISTLLDA
jgi:uncharacterized damage-inducible protein DinB